MSKEGKSAIPCDMKICESCGKKMPVTDESGRSNFVNIGNRTGFGFDRKKVCRECEMASRRLGRTRFLGWGR